MAKKAPCDPLIVIIGATGTGKSQLAVNLATEFNGEIINGDAMQMYDGLPIITNKITVEEQKGIPHHLLGIVGLDEEPWRVGVFKKKAERVIDEIRSRGRLPIVVGGTHYYTQSLLFKDVLVSDAVEGEEEVEDEMSREEIKRRYPVLERPTEEILEQLREVDPVMADRWHPNDRRKIQRSLEIYLMTGRKASKVYEEQRERRRLNRCNDPTTNIQSEPDTAATLLQSTIIFWVYAESEILKTRLDARVDRMVDMGLLNEVQALDSFLHKETPAGTSIDLSSGIWMSIGFKEFEPYLAAMKSDALSSNNLETIIAAAVGHTKAATRQYAKRQVRWIRLKFLVALSNANALDKVYLLDGTNLGQWSECVSNPAIKIVRKFLDREELPAPVAVSPKASELLAPKTTFEFCDRTDLWIREVCKLCNMTAVTEEQWQRHLKSRGHRRAVKKTNKVAIHGR